MTSRVKDPALAVEIDEAALAWQRHVTPITDHYCTEVAQRDYGGLRLAGWMHVTFNTLTMMLALKQAGAQIVIGACNVDSTDDRAAAFLSAQGITVYARRNMDRGEYAENLDRVRDANADVLCDMGGELIEASLGRRPPPRGALEATTSGLTRLAGLAIPFPVFDWNSLPLKDKLENRFHVADGVWPAFSHTTTLSLFGRRVLVVGYGPVGKGIAERARALGALVCVSDLDPVRLIEARHHGCQVVALEDGLAACEIVVTATGVERVLDGACLNRVRPGAILFNAGHSNREIDIDWLYAHPHRRMRPHIERFGLPDTHLYLLAQGSLLNLAAGAGPHGNDLFDHYTALMLLGIAWMFDGGAEGTPAGVQLYPAALERQVAARSIQLQGV